MITQKEALSIAKQIMAARTNYLLCGSVALIHAKAIPDRKVLDIDFVCPAHLFDSHGLDTYGGYGPIENDGYKCYKVQFDQAIKGFYYNVFVHDTPAIVEEELIDGVKIQSVTQMLAWKTSFNRLKDKQDLGVVPANEVSGFTF
jgi:hypothetical protein